MAQVVYFTGPQPAGTALFCTPCVMLYKGAALADEEIANIIAEATASPEKGAGPVIKLDLKDITRQRRPNLAVTMGMTTLPLPFPPGHPAAGQTTPVLTLLCWDHIYGLEFSEGVPRSVVPATAADMPVESRRGIPLVGGGHT